jgi:hypothetical protein
MQLNLPALHYDGRASITIEMALTTCMILIPLFSGGADFLEIIAARAQANAALNAFYTFAWNNPAAAADTTQLAAILTQLNQHSSAQITFPDGKTTGSTYQPTLTYFCAVPPSTTQTSQSTPCPAADTQQTTVTYNLTTSITVPVPLPIGLSNPYTLAVSGQVQIQ